MWLYVPQNLASKPAVVVGVHWCSGSAQAYYQGTQWARLSETYGFVVIYPQTPYTRDNCWDVSSRMTLTHGGGGASNSIVNMVEFVLGRYGADRGRVYVTGISSGAMMTVCLLLCPAFVLFSSSFSFFLGLRVSGMSCQWVALLLASCRPSVRGNRAGSKGASFSDQWWRPFSDRWGRPFHYICILTKTWPERTGSRIPRRLRRRHSLRGRPRGLLHERRRHTRFLELDLLDGPVGLDAAAVDRRRREHVPGWLQRDPFQDADLSW